MYFKNSEKKEWLNKWGVNDNVSALIDNATITSCDVGGPDKVVRYTVTIGDNVYKFLDRSIFDFGGVVNPDDGIGGIYDKGGKISGFDAVNHNGWYTVRVASDSEFAAFLAVLVHQDQESKKRIMSMSYETRKALNLLDI